MDEKGGNKLFLTFAIIVIVIVLIATFSLSANLTGNSIFDIFGKLFYSPQEVSVQGLLTSVTRTLSSSTYAPLVPVSVLVNFTFDPQDCGGAYVETIPSGFMVVNDSISGPGQGFYNPNLNRITWAPIDGPLCGGVSDGLLSYSIIATSVQEAPALVSGQFSVDGTTYPHPDDTLTINAQTLDFTISNGGDVTVPLETSSYDNLFDINIAQQSGEGLVSLYTYDLSENLTASFEPVSCLLNSENTSCVSKMNISIYSPESANYTLLVNATTGTITKSTSFILHAEAPEAVPNPTPEPTKSSSRKKSSSSSNYPPAVVNTTGQSYTITQEQLEKGYIRAFELNDILLFSLESQEHSMKVLEFSSDLVSLELKSEPMTISVNKGQVNDLDLNQDGKKDLRVRYDGSTLGKGIVYIQSLAPVKETTDTSNPNNTGEVVNKQSARVWLIAIILIILVIVIIVALTKFAKKK